MVQPRLNMLSTALNIRGAMDGGPTLDSVSVVLCACVFLFTVLAWYPILVGTPNSSATLRPAILLSLSSIVQLTFIVLVGRQLLLLEYSIKFAALGLPLCIWALVSAIRKKLAAPVLCVTLYCVIAGLVMWLFLITVH